MNKVSNVAFVNYCFIATKLVKRSIGQITNLSASLLVLKKKQTLCQIKQILLVMLTQSVPKNHKAGW